MPSLEPQKPNKLMQREEGSTMSLLFPDDWHLHLRDGEQMKDVLKHTIQRFRRAIIMPNLNPPICTEEQAENYRKRILSLLSSEDSLESQFTPLMTLYLTDQTSKEEIKRASRNDMIFGMKLYPMGSTTNSSEGVRHLAQLNPILSLMEELDLPLLIHAEETDPAIDIFDREGAFIDRYLQETVERFQGLRIVFEHISTSEAVDFVISSSERVAATITAHHLLMNRNSLFEGGIQPHNYCLPLLKTERDRLALVQAAVSGKADFFLGTDSAPHSQPSKERSCGCAGIYTSHCALELYAEVFEQEGALENLEGFASRNGPSFYQVPCNTDRIELIKKEQSIPSSFPYGSSRLIPFRSQRKVAWQISK